VVGSRVRLRFRVANARHEVLTITSPGRRKRATRSIEAGSGAVAWVPSKPGDARVRLTVEGLDGTTVTRSAALRVLNRPPTVRLTRAPARAVVGRRIRLSFKTEHALGQLVQISTREGTFTRRYLIRNGTGIIDWTPTRAGRAVVHVRARGREGQTAKDTARLTVAPERRGSHPEVALVRVPRSATVGRAHEIAFDVTGARETVARIAGGARDARVWRFARPTGRVTFAWTPTRSGRYRLIVSAHSRSGAMTQTATQLTAARTR
jgi:hypothetical protein